MPPLKTILFVLLFIGCNVGALLAPVYGIFGYILFYSIGPESQWWSKSIEFLGIRYQMTMAVLIAVGMALHWGKLRFGKRFFLGQERLMLAFLGLVWLTVAIGPASVGFTAVDHPAVKLTKVLIFVLMLTHVVTDLKSLDRLLWVITLGALLLGIQAWTEPRSGAAYFQGRLQGIGGPDFHDANTLAMYLVGLLPLIAVLFHRSRWTGKLFCLVSGAFAANAVVLTRSRGAVVALACGAAVGVLLAPKKIRLKILGGIVLLGIGILYLGDQRFFQRAATVTNAEEQRDGSAEGRVETWQAGLKMIAEHPLGVGAGNFRQSVGEYAAQFKDRDAHSTYIDCGCELGFLGLILLGALVYSTVRGLRRVPGLIEELEPADREHVQIAAHGMLVCVVVFLGSSLTGTLLYVESFWWAFALPVCLLRVVENLKDDKAVAQGLLDAAAESPPKSPSAAAPKVRRRRRVAAGRPASSRRGAETI